MTSTCCKKSLLAIVVGVLCTGVLLMSSLVGRAYAADLGGYYYTADGTKMNASPNDAWNKALELQTGMGITQDFTCDRLYIEGGKKVFVELNGHVVNRNLSSNQNEGEVFYVDDNATLTVYGGTKDDPSAGGDVVNVVRAWVTDTSGSLSHSTRSVRGGVITGGFSSNYGGGIEMRENATVNLNYVTVCGNRAAQTKGLDGYGGGVNMSRSYGKLYMDHASIVYNYAYNEGGGVFVNGGPGRKIANDCMIRMRHSHIDNNGAEDNGAGVGVRGERFQLIGDAKQVTNSADYSSLNFWSSLCFHNVNAETVWGSTIAYNVIQDSDDGYGGGGVYLWNDDCTVNGVNVIGNRALKGGCGGGIYTQEENVCITGCNVAFNIAEKQVRDYWITTTVNGGYGGGIHVNNDLTTIKGSTIVKNNANRNGGGVCVDGMVDVIAGGTLIVQGNTLEGGSQNNMFLQKKDGQEARVVVNGLSKGSLIGLTLDSGHSARVACGSSTRLSMPNSGETIDQRMFTSDGNVKYLYWNSKTNPWYDGYAIDANRSATFDYNERWLVARSRSDMPAGYETNPNVGEREFQPDDGSALKRTGSYLVGEKDYGLYQGVFGMPSFVDSAKDLSVEFFYSDGYFMEDPKQYNDHLATMSFALALAAGYSNMGNEGSFDNLYNTAGNGSTYYPVKCSNIIELLGDLGVAPDDIYVNEYNRQKPGTDTMGVAIGSKKIGDKTLVILGARGSGYKAEWASNVTLGSEGEASGFSTAATIAFDELQKYLSAHNIDGASEDTLFWLSGFSRAGVTVNLAAKRVVDTYDNGGNRTFAYPMEPPKGGLDSEEKEGCDYTCIHNVINNEDLVPYVAPTEMGFKRYGVDHYVPGTQANSNDIKVKTETVTIYDNSRNVDKTITVTSRRDNEPLTGDAYETARAEMVKQLRSVNPDVIYDDYFYQATLNFIANKINTSNITSLVGEVSSNDPDMKTSADFLELLFGDILGKGFNYNTKGTAKTDDYRRFFSTEHVTGSASFQDAVRTICGIAFSLDAQEKADVMEVFGNVMSRISASDLYFDIFWNSDDKWTEYEWYSDISNGKIQKTANSLWQAVSTRDEKKGFKSLYDVMDASKVDQIHRVWEPLVFPLLYWAHFDYKDNDSDMAGTLAYNAARIIQNHYPEVVVSYLRGTDGYYKGGANDSYYIMNWPQNKTQSFDLAVEVTHVADDGTTTTEFVSQEGFDERIVLTSSDDTIKLRSDPYNASAQVFYRYDGTDAWIQFDKPLSFPNIMAEGTLSQVSGDYRVSKIMFHAFTAGYATAEKGITVAYGIDGRLQLGSYVDSAFGMYSQTVPVGDGLTLDAAERIQIPDAKGTVAEFVRWRVERIEGAGEYNEITNDDELATILGEDFDAHEEQTTLTLMRKEDLRIVPLFREYEHISKLGVSAALGNALAATLNLSVYGNDTTEASATASKPVTWTQEGVSADGTPVYVGEVKLALDDLCPINDGWRNDAVAGTGCWFPGDTSSVSFESDTYEFQDLVLSQDECTLRVRVAEAPEEEVWKLVVTPRDIVTGTAYEDRTFYAGDADKDYRPDAPSLPHEDFCGWSSGWTVDEATHTKTIVAWYRPVLDYVTLTVNHGIVLGEELPEVQQMELRSGEMTWHAADGGLSSAWRTAGDADYQSTQTSAQARVTYEVAYGLADFAPHTDGLDAQAPSASFGIADDCVVEIKVGDDSLEVLRASVQEATVAGEGMLAATVRYKPVLNKVTSVDAGDPMVFSHGLSADALCDALQGVRVHATIDGERDGYVYTLRPNVAGDYDPGKLEQQSFAVVCELTSNEYSLEDCDTVELPITVLAAPEAQIPTVLTSGVYSDDTRLIIRHPDEQATVWYAVQAVPVAIGEDGEYQTETPDFDSAAFVTYDENENVVFGSEYRGQRIYVCAYATQDGYNDSARVVRSFEVMKAYAEVPYINAAGQDEDPKVARCLTATDNKLSYWSDANGGWYAVTEDLTVDDRVWIQGKINLILCDGATLELVSGMDVAADAGAKLIIWCQGGGTGALKAGHEVQGGPANDIDDLNGIITQSDGLVVLGDEDFEGDGLVALGDDGASAGYDAGPSSGGSSGSEVSPIDNESEDETSVVVEESAMQDNAAGIGSRDGLDLGEIAINGGVITCYGGKGAAGIGGCAEGEGSGVIIYNGTVTAVGGEGGAGIGSGRSGHLEYVLVQGGTVTATGGKDAAGIGGNVKAVALSWISENDSITASSYACEKLENFQLLRNFRFSDETFLLKEEDVLGSVDKTLVPRPAPIGGPSFKSLSLVLSGQIGVNFFVDLPAIEDVDYSQSYMEFMVGEQKATRADYDAHKKSENGKYYGFTCYVSSVQMAEPITATFYYGDGQTAECTNYSVQEYVRLLQADATEHPDKYSDEAINLAHAIIDYGYHVQPFLAGANQWGIGADYKQVDQDLVTAKSYDWYDIQYKVEEYECEVELERSGLSDVTMRLNLNSSTSMEFLFTTPSTMPVDIENSAYTLIPQDTHNGTRWCVTVPDIPAHKLGDMVEVTGGTDVSGFTIRASPMTYVKIVLSDEPYNNEYSEEAKNAMCAFYKYYEAAMAYRNSLVGAL